MKPRPSPEHTLCPSCKGCGEVNSWTPDGNEPRRCGGCNGSGWLRFDAATGSGKTKDTSEGGPPLFHTQLCLMRDYYRGEAGRLYGLGRDERAAVYRHYAEDIDKLRLNMPAKLANE